MAANDMLSSRDPHDSMCSFSAQKEYEECILRLDALEGENSQFKTESLCTLSPDQPFPLRLIATGTDDDTEQKVIQQRIQRQNSFERRQTTFGDRIKEFCCWRRWQDIAPEAALFCHRTHPSTHEWPLCLRLPAQQQEEPTPPPLSPGANASGVLTAESSVFTPSRPKSANDFVSVFNDVNRSIAEAAAGFQFQTCLPSFQQGAVADHYFLLAVAAVLQNKAMFTDLFASVEFLKRGMLTFRFFSVPDTSSQKQPLPTPFSSPSRAARGESPSLSKSPRRIAIGNRVILVDALEVKPGTIGSTDVFPPPIPPAVYYTVDTLLPCVEGRQFPQVQAAVGRTDHEEEFWLTFLEKAYATFTGSYARLHHGRSDLALRHLTRGEPTILRWRREGGEDGGLSDQGLAELRFYLQEATLLKLPMISADTSGSKPMTDGGDSEPVQYPEDIRHHILADHKENSQLANFDWSEGKVVLFCMDYLHPLDGTADGSSVAPSPSPSVRGNRSRSPPKSAQRARSSRSRMQQKTKPFTLLKSYSLYDQSFEPLEGSPDRVSLQDGFGGTINGELDAEDGDEGPRAFSESSPYWTKHSRRILNHYSVDTKLQWQTLQDFVYSADALLIMRNTYQLDGVLHFSAIPRAVPDRYLPLLLPHFLLVVEKIDDGPADGAGFGMRSALKTSFDDLTQVAAPKLELGEETDDEADGQQMSSRASSTDQLLPNASQSLKIHFRVAFPSPAPTVEEDLTKPKPSTNRYSTETLSVMAFRSPTPTKQRCVLLESETGLVATLPAHAQVGTTLLARNQYEMLFEMEANTGCYNIVVAPPGLTVPASSSIDDLEVAEPSDHIFSIAATKSQNADSYNIRFVVLPN